MQKASNDFIQFKLARNITVDGTIRNSKFLDASTRVGAEDLLQFRKTNLPSFSNQCRQRKPRSMDGRKFLNFYMAKYYRYQKMSLPISDFILMKKYFVLDNPRPEGKKF